MNMNGKRKRGNLEKLETKTPPSHLVKYRPLKQEKRQAASEIIYNTRLNTPFEDLLKIAKYLERSTTMQKVAPQVFKKFKGYTTCIRIQESQILFNISSL